MWWIIWLINYPNTSTREQNDLHNSLIGNTLHSSVYLTNPLNGWMIRPLLQEIYQDDAWKMMVCCILLNLTKRQQVDLVRNELFSLYPTPYHMINSDEKFLSHLLQPLGLHHKRAHTLRRFSQDYINGFQSIQECYGVGQYGMDSWNIFQLNKMTNQSNDKVLHQYLEEIKWNKTLQLQNTLWYL